MRDITESKTYQRDLKRALDRGHTEAEFKEIALAVSAEKSNPSYAIDGPLTKYLTMIGRRDVTAPDPNDDNYDEFDGPDYRNW